MLKSSDKIAIWMESSLDDDFGKMGISALRYLNNEIVCVIDSVFAGKKISEVSIIKKDIPIVSSVKDARDMGANIMLLGVLTSCLLYTSPSPRDLSTSRMPSSA